jgi:hemerythrin-like metal-binding protein
MNSFRRTIPRSMVTGLTAIDDQHEALFGQIWAEIARLETSGSVGSMNSIGSLIGEFAVHFANEEKLMTESGYYGAGRHAEQHAAFMRHLEQIASRIEGDRAAVLQVASDMLDILVRDDLQNDIEFVTWLEFMKLDKTGDAPG